MRVLIPQHSLRGGLPHNHQQLWRDQPAHARQKRQSFMAIHRHKARAPAVDAKAKPALDITHRGQIQSRQTSHPITPPLHQKNRWRFCHPPYRSASAITIIRAFGDPCPKTKFRAPFFGAQWSNIFSASRKSSRVWHFCANIAAISGTAFSGRAGAVLTSRKFASVFASVFGAGVLTGAGGRGGHGRFHRNFLCHHLFIPIGR